MSALRTSTLSTSTSTRADVVGVAWIVSVRTVVDTIWVSIRVTIRITVGITVGNITGVGAGNTTGAGNTAGVGNTTGVGAGRITIGIVTTLVVAWWVCRDGA